MRSKSTYIGNSVCLGHYEHIHTIPYKIFCIGIGLGLCQCEHTLNLKKITADFYLKKNC